MSLFKERSLKHYSNQFEPNEVYWRLYEDKEISFVFNQIFSLSHACDKTNDIFH